MIQIAECLGRGKVSAVRGIRMCLPRKGFFSMLNIYSQMHLRKSRCRKALGLPALCLKVECRSPRTRKRSTLLPLHTGSHREMSLHRNTLGKQAIFGISFPHVDTGHLATRHCVQPQRQATLPLSCHISTVYCSLLM